MKTQKYLVTIEMPDGDMIGPGWIKDIIQADCDVEDTGRQKVSVEEIKAEESPGKTLEDAARAYLLNEHRSPLNRLMHQVDAKIEMSYHKDIEAAFKAGAKWVAEQGVTLKVTDDTTWGEVNDFIHRNCDGVKEIQIRKKEEKK